MSLGERFSDIFEINRETKRATLYNRNSKYQVQPEADVLGYIPAYYNPRDDNCKAGVMILDVPGHECQYTREYVERQYQLWLIYHNVDNYWRFPENPHLELMSCDLYKEYPNVTK